MWRVWETWRTCDAKIKPFSPTSSYLYTMRNKHIVRAELVKVFKETLLPQDWCMYKFAHIVIEYTSTAYSSQTKFQYVEDKVGILSQQQSRINLHLIITEEHKISFFFQGSDTGFINHTLVQEPLTGVIESHKIDCIFVWFYFVLVEWLLVFGVFVLLFLFSLFFSFWSSFIFLYIIIHSWGTIFSQNSRKPKLFIA